MPSTRRIHLLTLCVVTLAVASTWQAWAAPAKASSSALKTCKRKGCCIPYPSDGKIYAWKPTGATLPLKKRRPLHLAFTDKAYKAKYLAAYKALKALPPSDPRSMDSQMAAHCAYCSARVFGMDIHRSWLFYPWHRMFIYFHERILQKLIKDPTFMLPYWNWDNIAGRAVDLEFLNPSSVLYRRNRNTYFNSLQSQVSYGCEPANVQTAMIDTADTYDFMGYPSGQSRGGRVEMSMHGNIHVAVGLQDYPWADMGNLDTAAADALFFLHHNNIDRFWWLWRKLPEDPNGRKRSDPTSTDFLDSSFLIYDENKKLVQVRVRDVVSHTYMGYTFEDVDLDWLPGDVDIGPHPYDPKTRRRNLLEAGEGEEEYDFDPDTIEELYNPDRLWEQERRRRLLGDDDESEEPSHVHTGRHYRKGNRNRTMASGNFTMPECVVRHYHYHRCENGTFLDQERDAEATYNAEKTHAVCGQAAAPTSSYAPVTDPPPAPQPSASPPLTTYTLGKSPVTAWVERVVPEKRKGYVATQWDKDGNCLKRGAANLEALAVEGLFLFKDEPLMINVFLDNPYADVSTSYRRNTGFVGSHTHVPMGADNMGPTVKKTLMFPLRKFFEREDKLDVTQFQVTFVCISFQSQTGVRQPCSDNKASFEKLTLEYK